MNTTVTRPLQLTAGTFDEAVQKSTKPVMVDFWAEWCGPCRVMGYVLQEVAQEVGESAMIAKLNVDEHPDIASRYGIQSIPTVIIFKEGKVMDRIVGAVPKKVLIQRLAVLAQPA